MTGSLNRYRVSGTFECDEIPGNNPEEAQKKMEDIAVDLGIRVHVTGVVQDKNWFKVEDEVK